MATGLRPLKLLALWVGVPVALYAVGYNFVGPRIGSRVPEHFKQIAGDQVAMLHKQVQKIVTPAQQATAPRQESVTPKPPPAAAQPLVGDPATTPSQSDTGGPEVQVSVRSERTGQTSVRTDGSVTPRKPRVHHKPKPKPKPKPESTDEGSYGGTQDQGTSPPDPPTGG